MKMTSYFKKSNNQTTQEMTECIRPVKKVKLEGGISTQEQLKERIKNIKTPNDVKEVKEFLRKCHRKDIEDIEKYMTEQTFEMYTFPRWCNQNEKQAFISNILFPVQLEESNELLSYVYINPLTHIKLAFCSKHNDPLSMMHLSEIIKINYKNDEVIPKSISTFRKQLKETSKKSFHDTKFRDKENIPFWGLGELAKMIKYQEPMYFYLKGEKDYRCKSKLALLKKDTESLKEITNNYPLAYLYLGSLNDCKEKKDYFTKAIEFGVVYGHYELGNLYLKQNNIDEGISHLKIAGEKGIPSAYMLLAEYYSDKKDYQNMIKMYENAGEFHPFAYIELGEIHKNTNMEKANQYFCLDRINGYKYGGGRKEDKNEYFTDIQKISNLIQ